MAETKNYRLILKGLETIDLDDLPDAINGTLADKSQPKSELKTGSKQGDYTLDFRLAADRTVENVRGTLLRQGLSIVGEIVEKLDGTGPRTRIITAQYPKAGAAYRR